jgi:ADP-ribose pyrophosphatase YjhB (NUDIX family)
MIKIVGSALIKNNEGKYLAVKLDKEVVGGVFVPPGGKLENDESLRDCVIREVKEELNIEITISGIVAVNEKNYEDGYWTFVLFDASIIEGIPTIMEPDKILETKWVDINDFENSSTIKWIK